jgi:hypothetical protein
LNMCPLMKSRIKIRLTAAHTLRFWMTGRAYGQATKAPVTLPSTIMMVIPTRSQLIGLVKVGCGRSGRFRAIQEWTTSAFEAL